MSDELSQYEKFIARLAGITPDSTPEEVVELSGLDRWTHDGSALDPTERETYFDATSGDAMEIVHYQGTLTPPAGFPSAWPFIPEADYSFTTTTAGDQEASYIVWPLEERSLEIMVELVTAAMTALGWHTHVATAVPTHPASEALCWFHRDAAWRLLTHIPRTDPPFLGLNDWRPDLRGSP